MKKQLKYGLDQHNASAPMWLQKALQIISILFVAKYFVINGIPGISDSHAELAGQWWDYTVNTFQFVIAIGNIIIGEHAVPEDEEL